MRSSKYGRKIRRLVETAEKMKKTKYECLQCGKKKVKRVSNAIWKCTSCKKLFAGGAYSFTTLAGSTFLRLLNGEGHE